jgi:hypothetical protein
MKFASPQECVEAIATEMIHSAPVAHWDKLELRVIRWSAESTTRVSSCYAEGTRLELRLPGHADNWVEALAQMVSTPDKGLFSRLSLDVAADGSFQARYGYGPVSEEDEVKLALGELPKDFWP